MSHSTQKQLCLPPVAGMSVRGNFDGGAMSSDFGPIILGGVDRQIGLTERLAQAFDDQRHPSYIDHALPDLFAQRIYQVASGYEDGNDANALRRDPLFKLGVGHKPLDPDADLASAPTFSRLEHAATTKDVYRIARAFVDQFIASYAAPLKVIVLDMDHSEDATYGQQELSFYNHHYRSYCYLPLFLFERVSGKFITAGLLRSNPPVPLPCSLGQGSPCSRFAIREQNAHRAHHSLRFTGCPHPKFRRSGRSLPGWSGLILLLRLVTGAPRLFMKHSG